MKQGLPLYNTYVLNDLCGETVSLAVGTTSVSVTFVLPSSAKNYDVLVSNSGSKAAFINFGLASAGTVTAKVPGTGGVSAATIGATPVLPGAIYTFQKQSDNQLADTCAAICGGSDSTTLYFTSVQGS